MRRTSDTRGAKVHLSEAYTAGFRSRGAKMHLSEAYTAGFRSRGAKMHLKFGISRLVPVLNLYQVHFGTRFLKFELFVAIEVHFGTSWLPKEMPQTCNPENSSGSGSSTQTGACKGDGANRYCATPSPPPRFIRSSRRTNTSTPESARQTDESPGLPGLSRAYALIFSLAAPASVLNALMSFTARSASILRFTWMPASFRPCISLL